jgi:hypothetical protein
MLSEQMHADLFSELRFTAEDVIKHRDGIDVATLEIDRSDLAGLKFLAHFKYLRSLRRTATGLGLAKGFRKAVRGASAIGLITTQGRRPKSYFNGGRAMQGLWLHCTDHGLAVQPLTASLYVINRLLDGDGEGLSPSQRTSFQTLRMGMEQLFPLSPDRAEILIFRLAFCPPPTARSLRFRWAKIAGEGFTGAVNDL